MGADVDCVAILHSQNALRRSQTRLAASFVLTPYGFHCDLGALLAFVAIAALQNERAPHTGTRTLYAVVLALPLWAPLMHVPNALLVLPALTLSVLLLVFSLAALRQPVLRRFSPAFQ